SDVGDPAQPVAGQGPDVVHVRGGIDRADEVPQPSVASGLGQPAESPIRAGDRPSNPRPRGLSWEDYQVEANLDALAVSLVLREDQRPATPDEQYVLSQYRGWGGLSAVFNDNDDRFARPRDELRSYLTEEEYNSARRTVLTSYFTPPEIVDAMWSALETAGFDGGRVLEPGCGIGGF